MLWLPRRHLLVVPHIGILWVSYAALASEFPGWKLILKEKVTWISIFLGFATRLDLPNELYREPMQVLEI